jgi:hypothetical protein
MFDEWNTLNEQVYELYSQGKFDEAIIIAERLLQNLFFSKP